MIQQWDQDGIVLCLLTLSIRTFAPVGLLSYTIFLNI